MDDLRKLVVSYESVKLQAPPFILAYYEASIGQSLIAEFDDTTLTLNFPEKEILSRMMSHVPNDAQSRIYNGFKEAYDEELRIIALEFLGEDLTPHMKDYIQTKLKDLEFERIANGDLSIGQIMCGLFWNEFRKSLS